MEIKIDDLSSSAVVAFLEAHLEDMKSVSPPDNIHALDLAGLKKPEVTFWTVWDQGKLIGCGALKELDRSHAEIKSMRTAPAYRGKGVATGLLRHILVVAEQRGYKRLSLESGSMPYFRPAHALYKKLGFTPCQPFSTYTENPNSVYMTMKLHNA